MNRTLRRRFHEVEYIVKLNSEVDQIILECENRNLDKWRATFTAKFIEEITHRTGNFKPFSVFVKMLCSAFDGDSPSVSLDLLTSEDLDALRQASGVRSGQRPAQSGPSSKRYLILTYMGAFDKVHYPMALTYSEVEDSAELKRTIVRLRDELEGLQRSHIDSASLHELESMVMSYKSEKDKLERELNHYSIENNKLMGLVEALKSDNQSLRSRIDFLENQGGPGRRSRPVSASSPKRAFGASFAASPANSLRRPSPTHRTISPARSIRATSPYQGGRSQRPPTGPSSRLPSGAAPPRRSRPPSLRSPTNSVRSEVVSPRQAPGSQMSEVDARLEALQKFLKHQRSMRPVH